MSDEPTTHREPTFAEIEKWQAEGRKADAEARKADAEAAKFSAEGEKAAAEAAVASVASRKALREEQELLTRNQYHRTYHFTQAVSESSVNACMAQLDIWRRRDDASAREPIEVVFTSPGGGVIEGMVLFDYLQTLRREGITITTGTLGMAASMAGILLQAGDVRWMGKEAWVLIHEASFAAVGSMGQVEDTVEWVKKISRRILQIFATRSKMSEAYINRRWKRKDWWIDSDEALKLGLVDELR